MAAGAGAAAGGVAARGRGAGPGGGAAAARHGQVGESRVQRGMLERTAEKTTHLGGWGGIM